MKAADPVKILLVEDNAGDARLLREALAESPANGFQLFHALRLSDALQQLEADVFDIVLLDLTLPDGQGMETVRRMHVGAGGIPIVVLTGLNDDSFAMRAVREGAQDYLTKGQISGDLLHRSIRYAIERNRAETALRQSEKRFRALIEKSSDAIMLVDAEGVCLYAGPSTSRAVGNAPEAWVGRTIWQMIHPDDLPAIQQDIQRLLEQPGASSRVRFRFLHPDGSERWVDACHTNLLHEPGVSALVCNYRDITEQMNLEAQLRQAQKIEGIGQLAAGVAHDFNNILTVIQGHVSLLLEKSAGTPSESPLQQVELATERASSLTRQLLMFSRKQVMQLKTIDLNHIINNMAVMLRRLIGEDIYILFLYDEELPGIEADPGMIEQIILNLAVNARDAMPKGGQLTISTYRANFDPLTAAAHPGAPPGSYVTLKVTDTGCGMDSATMSHIFEPFFTTKEVGKGTGLGLATVYGIVKQHHGWIDVASQPGKGSTFTISFPGSTSKNIVSSKIEDQPQPRGGPETILVVEDEPLLRELAIEILQEAGYAVIGASTGREAVTVFGQHAASIDLVLTDLVMPEGVSGRELVVILRQQRPKLRVIYTSGYSVDMVATELGGDEFLQKPYKPAVLLQTIRRSLEAVQ